MFSQSVWKGNTHTHTVRRIICLLFLAPYLAGSSCCTRMEAVGGRGLLRCWEWEWGLHWTPEKVGWAQGWEMTSRDSQVEVSPCPWEDAHRSSSWTVRGSGHQDSSCLWMPWGAAQSSEKQGSSGQAAWAVGLPLAAWLACGAQGHSDMGWLEGQHCRAQVPEAWGPSQALGYDNLAGQACCNLGSLAALEKGSVRDLKKTR